MVHHVYYVPSVKHQKFPFMRIMAFLEISFTFCLRKLNLTLNEKIVVIVRLHLIFGILSRYALGHRHPNPKIYGRNIMMPSTMVSYKNATDTRINAMLAY